MEQERERRKQTLRTKLRQMRADRTGETYREAVKAAGGKKAAKDVAKKLDLGEAQTMLTQLGLSGDSVAELFNGGCSQTRRNEIMREFYENTTACQARAAVASAARDGTRLALPTERTPLASVDDGEPTRPELIDLPESTEL